MKRKVILIGTGWLASTAAAFFIGKSFRETSATTTVETNSKTISKVSSRPTDTEPVQDSVVSRMTSMPTDRTDFSAKIGELANLSDPIERTKAFLELVKNLSPDEFQDAVAAFRTLGMTRERMGEYSILLTGWAQVDPLAALTYAKEHTGGPFARQTILASWAKESPQAAIAWARENFEGEEGQANPWLVGVIKGIANTDLTQATTLLNELPFSRERGNALGSIISILEQQGPEASKAWVAQLTDERLQAGAAARIAARLASDDPQGALNWVSSLGPEATRRSAPEVIDSWVKEDQQAVLSWLDTQSDDVRSAAAPNLIRNLDINDAQDWLINHEGNPAYDDAIRTFAWRTMDDTPELGADWIMKITNDRQRIRTFHRVLRPWLNKDPAGAIDYVQNNNVPESIRDRMAKEMQDQQGG